MYSVFINDGWCDKSISGHNNQFWPFSLRCFRLLWLVSLWRRTWRRTKPSTAAWPSSTHTTLCWYKLIFTPSMPCSQHLIELCPVRGLTLFYFSLQVVNHLKPIISAAAHLLGMKDVDNGERVLEYFYFILRMTLIIHHIYIYTFVLFRNPKHPFHAAQRSSTASHQGIWECGNVTSWWTEKQNDHGCHSIITPALYPKYPFHKAFHSCESQPNWK